MTKIKIHQFHKVLTKILVGDKYMEVPSFHSKILDLYNNDDRLQLVVAPIGFAKSTTIKTFALKEMFEGNRFQLYVSSTATKVSIQMTALVKLVADPVLQQLFNYTVVKANTTDIALDFGGEVRVLSGVASGSDISGINFENVRPNCILVDDLEELDQAHSIYRTEALVAWLEQTLIGRLPSLVDGRLRMIGTNLTKNSIVNRILKGQIKGWQSYRFPALDENGESIWEERHPAAALMKLKLENPTVFASNYQNEPIDITEALISSGDLRYYQTTNLNDFDKLYIHADTTHTGSQTSDYFSAGVLGENTKDKNFYLIDFILEKCDVEVQARQTITLFSKYRNKIARITYDEKSNQGFGFWIKKLAKEEYNLSLPIEELRYPSDKVSHLTPHIPHFKANRIYLPSGHPMIAEATSQITSFPSRAVHDDFVDMMSGLMDNFKPEEVKRPSFFIV